MCFKIITSGHFPRQSNYLAYSLLALQEADCLSMVSRKKYSQSNVYSFMNRLKSILNSKKWLSQSQVQSRCFVTRAHSLSFCVNKPTRVQFANF